MWRSVFVLLVLGCHPKQPLTPSYFHAKPPEPVTYYSCQDTVTCYARCSPTTEQCMQWCDGYTTLEDARDARALNTCLQSTHCSSETCTREQCGTQIDTCTNERKQKQPGEL